MALIGWGNFIDLKEVNPKNESVQQLQKLIIVKNIELDTPQRVVLAMEEYRTDLQDDILNFLNLAEPSEVNYINYSNTHDQFVDLVGNPPLTVHISLSRKVIIQSRVVYDIFMMLGEVGGLNDFFVLISSTILGYFSEQLLTASVIEKSYRVKVSQFSVGKMHKARFDSLHFSLNFLLMYACAIGRCKNQRKMELFKAGSERIDEQLDVVKILRLARAFKTVQRMQFSRTTRHMIRLQRRDGVLEGVRGSSSDEDEMSDTSLMGLVHDRLKVHGA